MVVRSSWCHQRIGVDNTRASWRELWIGNYGSAQWIEFDGAVAAHEVVAIAACACADIVR